MLRMVMEAAGLVVVLLFVIIKILIDIRVCLDEKERLLEIGFPDPPKPPEVEGIEE